MGPGNDPDIRPFGDSALLVVLGSRIDVELNERVHVLASSIRSLREAGDRRWGVPIPGYSSVLVPYDAERLTYGEACEALRGRVRAVAETGGSVDLGVARGGGDRPLEIGVRYGADDGPDLAEVADRLGLTPGDVIALHSSATYRVFLIGFVPGFGYLGPLPGELVLPRRATPRARVPAGSVAIAGEQTGVYPLETPGGWHLIGRTDEVLWDVHRDPPALLRPGALVRFIPLG